MNNAENWHSPFRCDGMPRKTRRKKKIVEKIVFFLVWLLFFCFTTKFALVFAKKYIFCILALTMHRTPRPQNNTPGRSVRVSLQYFLLNKI